MKVYQVVTYHNLQTQTREGWALDQVLSTSRGQSVSCQTPLAQYPSSANAPYNSGGVVNYPRDEVVQVHEPMFLLSKDLDMITREEALTAEREEARKRAADIGKERDALVISNKKMLESEASMRQRTDELISRMTTSAAELTKTQNSLTKIRVAIGQKAFDEIVT